MNKLTHFSLVMGMALLFGLIFWLLDSAFHYYYFHSYLRFLIFEAPESFLDSMLWNLSPHTLFVRFSFLVVCLIGGLLTAWYMDQQREAAEALTIRLRYEEGLAACSQALLSDNLPEALARLRAASDVCRVSIFENYEIAGAGLWFRPVHQVCAPDKKPVSFGPLSYADSLSRWEKLLSADQPVVGPVSSLPPSERLLLEAQHILSILLLPIWVEGQWYGFIGFDDSCTHRQWDEEDIRLLRTGAQMIGAYLARKRNEEELRASEERYHTTIDAMNDIVHVVDQEQRVLLCNKALRQMLRQLDIQHEPIGIPICDLFSFLSPQVCAQYDQVFQTGQPLVTEEATELNNQLHWTKTRKIPIRDEAGEVYRVVTILHDITEYKQAEAQIRQRNRELTLLNQVISVSTLSLEPQAILQTVCCELIRAFELSYGAAILQDEEYNRFGLAAQCTAETTGYLETIFIDPEDPAVQPLFTLSGSLAAADVYNAPQLEPAWPHLEQYGIVSMLSVPLYIKREQIGSLILLATERRDFSEEEVNLAWNVADQVAGALARARLDQERRRLSAVIKQTAEQVVITDTKGIIVYVNPAFEALSGYTAAELIGQDGILFRSDKQDETLYQEIWAFIQSGQVWQGRLIMPKKDGSHYTVDGTISVIRDEQGRPVNYVAVQRDITRELRLEEQYRQMQKMEAIGRLTAGIAHDFNNLLTAVNGFAALLKMELPPDTSQQALVDKVLRSGERAAELVRQLLAFGRKQEIKPRLIGLNQLISETEEIFKRLLGEAITLELWLQPDLWPVKVDPVQMEQVLVNLVINARDAMPEGGSLLIETTNQQVTTIQAAQSVDLIPGDYVILTVQDTGIGMDEETQQHIFEPFFTTKEVGDGTGLGLASVFGIIKHSDGYIQVCSEPGRGTNFTIYLPRSGKSQPPEYSKVDKNQEVDLSAGSETILLVEDESVVRDLVQHILNQQGYNVLEAANGQQALQRAQKYPGEIDLLLTDMRMPYLGGESLVEQVTLLYPHIKVLFISGHKTASQTGRLFLPKPFSPKDLAAKVRQVLEGG